MSASDRVPGPDDVAAVLAEPASRLRLVHQPIVDLARGTVAGFETLARIVGPPDAAPDVWFGAAAAAGLGGPLTAVVLGRVIDELDDLPRNTFVTVNLEPPDLDTDEVLEVLERRSRLDRLVLEITEHAVVEDHEALAAALAPLRARGAMVAVDDVGAGYSGLRAILTLRPHIIKLDRWLIDHLDVSPLKRTMVEMLGQAVDAMDTWVLAEGIERSEELTTLIGLEVPLGQGYLLGRPAPERSTELSADLVSELRHRNAARELSGHVAPLIVDVERCAIGSRSTAKVAVEVDANERPVALSGHQGRITELLLAKPSETVAAVGRRVAHRSAARWHDPVVVCGPTGQLLGIVPVQRLIEQLARWATRPGHRD